MKRLRLFSDGLLSKWGFDDGDIPEELWDHLDELGIDCPKWRPVLIQLVRRHLLPVLDQNVTVVEIGTIHNPIRAETVDGTDVTDGWYDEPAVTLSPESVEIPLDQVLAVIEELRQ